MISKNPWFGPKKLGYGWSPVSWQGWFTTFFLIVVVTILAKLYPAKSLPIIFVVLVVFIVIAYLTSDRDSGK